MFSLSTKTGFTEVFGSNSQKVGLMIAWCSQPASLTAGKQFSPSETTDVPGRRCFFALLLFAVTITKFG